MSSSVDIRTVGAGGGSIAHVPELTKALRVGPQSAGADPGPAAYARGGTEPTVTDANVVLGYLPEMQKLGGEMALDRKLSQQAVQKIADALKLSIKDAALGIYDIVNENMVGALRLVSVEQGYDPRDYALIAFGGAGPLHANALSPRAHLCVQILRDVRGRTQQDSQRTGHGSRPLARARRRGAKGYQHQLSSRCAVSRSGPAARRQRRFGCAQEEGSQGDFRRI
jgi:hypothetical protein